MKRNVILGLLVAGVIGGYGSMFGRAFGRGDRCSGRESASRFHDRRAPNESKTAAPAVQIFVNGSTAGQSQ